MRIWGLLALLVGMGSARADVATPWSGPVVPVLPMAQAPATTVIRISGAPARDPDPEPQPGREFAFPTGDVLLSGHAVWTQHDIVINTWDRGLTDRLEFGVLIPDAPVIDHLGLRYRLTPRRSPLKLTVGGGLALNLLSSTHLWGGASLTVAYVRPRYTLHATALEYRAHARADVVQVQTAGLGWRASRLWNLSADLFWLARSRAPVCKSYHEACSSRFQVSGLLVGARVGERDYALELGALFLPTLMDRPLPIISFVHVN